MFWVVPRQLTKWAINIVTYKFVIWTDKIDCCAVVGKLTAEVRYLSQLSLQRPFFRSSKDVLLAFEAKSMPVFSPKVLWEAFETERLFWLLQLWPAFDVRSKHNKMSEFKTKKLRCRWLQLSAERTFLSSNVVVLQCKWHDMAQCVPTTFKVTLINHSKKRYFDYDLDHEKRTKRWPI
jgi:hypothetical protein